MLAATIASPATGRPAVRAPYEQPTRMELRSAKKTYIVGEPVFLKAMLFNDRDRAIKGPYADEFAFSQSVEILYRRPGAEFTKYTPKWLSLVRSFCTVVLVSRFEPHRYIERKLRLFFDTGRGRLVLEEPGKYEFKIVFYSTTMRDAKQTFEATVSVNVVGPAANDATAVRVMAEPLLASFLEGDIQLEVARDEEVEAGALRAVEFLQRYGRSSVAAFVRERTLEIISSGNRQIDPNRLPGRLKGIYLMLEERP